MLLPFSGGHMHLPPNYNLVTWPLTHKWSCRPVLSKDGFGMSIQKCKITRQKYPARVPVSLWKTDQGNLFGLSESVGELLQ